MKHSVEINLPEGFLAGEKMALLINRIILVGMMGCLVFGLVDFVERVFSGWHGEYLPWLAMLVALEATFTLGQVRRSRELEMSVITYRFVEAVVLLILLKLFFYSMSGWDQMLREIGLPAGQLIAVFLNTEYLFAALVLLVVWILSTWLMNDLFEIESALILLDAEGYEKYFSNCAAIRGSLANRLLWLGMSMVAMVWLANIDFQRILAGEVSKPAISTWNVLVYFALLMLLLSLTYFSTLRAGWAWERIPLDRQVAIRWLFYVLGVLVIIAGVVSLLPRQYSLGFLTTLGIIFNLFMNTLTAVVFLIFYLIAQLMALIFSLFGADQESAEISEPMSIPDFAQAQQAAERVSGSELLQSVIFWVVFLFIVGFAFSQYIRQNEYLLAKLREISVWQILEQSWKWLSNWLRGVSKEVENVVQNQWQRLRVRLSKGTPVASFSFVNLRRLSPRQQVIFYYLALVRRGQEAGIPRNQAQTPREYEQELLKRLQPDETLVDASLLNEITDAFQDARYSDHEITPHKASAIKSAWQNMRQFLRRSNR